MVQDVTERDAIQRSDASRPATPRLGDVSSTEGLCVLEHPDPLLSFPRRFWQPISETWQPKAES